MQQCVFCGWVELNDVLYLAWRYLRYNRGKTAVLVVSISLILFLPAGLHVAVREASRSLTARADTTPLLVGAAGSAVDLTLAALYFRAPSLATIPYAEVDRVAESGLERAIPLHLRHEAGGHRIVGTTADHIEFRGLEFAAGRGFAIVGECVLGAQAPARSGSARKTTCCRRRPVPSTWPAASRSRWWWSAFSPGPGLPMTRRCSSTSKPRG